MDSTMNPMTNMATAAPRSGAVQVGELLRWPGAPAMFTAPDPDGNALEIVEVKP